MTITDEQQQRHAATMAFFQSAEDAWQEIQALLKGQDEGRRELEESFNDRRYKPKSDAKASAK